MERGQLLDDTATQIEAIKWIGGLGVGLTALWGLQIILLGQPRLNTPLARAGIYGLWIGIAAIVAAYALHPAVRAVGLVNSPYAFVVVGVILGVALFAFRRWMKGTYGAIEVVVGVATLIILGREYDEQPELTVLIGFIGAVYVIVRGLTNIAEAMKAARRS